MTCMRYSDFESLYPTKGVIAEGSYGKVYDASQYIVKEQDWTQSTFIKEVSFLAQISHPNICRLEGISFEQDKGYFSMFKGMNIRLALRKGLISFQELITDLVSAIVFLSRFGIAHADIKIENCIFLNGRLQLIDFGLTKMGILFDDGYYFSGVSYSAPYMDPEFSFTYMNSIKAETYALAALMYFLNNPINRNILYFPSTGQNDDENNFLQECQKFMSERKPIDELKNHPYILQDRLIPKDVGTVPYKNVLTGEDTGMRFPFIFISGIAAKHHLHSRTAFLGFEICRSAISQGWTSSDKTNHLLAKLSLYIAACILEFKFPDLHDWIQDYDFLEFKEGLCKLFTLFEGKFYTLTQWDSLMNSDFSDSINAMMSPGYDPDYVVQLPSSFNENSKNINWQMKMWQLETFPAILDIKLDECLMSLLEKGNENLNRRTLSQHELILQSSVHLDMTNADPTAFYYLMRNIIVYRKFLPELNFKLSLDVLNVLIKNAKISKSHELLEKLTGNIRPLDFTEIIETSLRDETNVFQLLHK